MTTHPSRLGGTVCLLLAASEGMVAALERADEVLSTWREDTELAQG